ncbi:MAG: nucleotidyltransferase domain-containing protein [Armatimonadia bacterium]
MDQEQLQQLVDAIVEAVQPLQIILFGSAARGQMHPGSDLDVLVVMPNGTHRRHTAQYLYRVIRGIKIPFDLVVATPDDLQRHADNPGLIYRDILQEGKTLYAA